MFNLLTKIALQTHKTVLAAALTAPNKNVQLVQYAFMNCKFIYQKNLRAVNLLNKLLKTKLRIYGSR
jgi:hypothetical protein